MTKRGSTVLAILLPVILACGNAYAANDDLSRDVTVEKEYTPTIPATEKIYPTPTEETHDQEKLNVTYSTWSKAEDVTSSPSQIKAPMYDETHTDNSRNGIFKVGLGFYWQTLADFYYPLLRGDKYLLDINVKHNSNWSNIRYIQDEPYNGYCPRGASHSTSADLTFEYQFADCRLSSAVDFSYNGFDYYGFSTVSNDNDSLKNTMGNYLSAGMNFDLFSTNTKKDVQYDVKFGYHYFGGNLGVKENDIDVEANVFGTAGNGKIGAIIGIDGNVYGTDSTKITGIRDIPFVDSIYNPDIRSNAKFTINPYYKLIGDNWSLVLGADLYIMAQQHARRAAAGCANIKGQFGFVPDKFYLYAGIGGDFKANSYYDMIKENHFIDPSLSISPTYTPLNVNLGVKVNIMKGLLFDLGFNYNLILDQYFYVNNIADSLYYNTFGVVYENMANHVCVNAGLYFDKIEGLNLGLTAKYNYWGLKDNEHAWQKPTWEISFDGKYKFLEKWQVGLSYNFLGGRYAYVEGEAVKMKDIHDLNVSLTYKALDWLSVFVNGKNLINIKADSYYGYRNFGINGMAGVTFSF